jgi:acyl-homoserine lactone acylase PvdQ
MRRTALILFILNVASGFNTPLLALPPDQLQAIGGLRSVFAQNALASVRTAWDLSDLDGSLGIGGIGQSGDPRSAFYSDQAELWREGIYQTLPFTNRALGCGIFFCR